MTATSLEDRPHCWPYQWRCRSSTNECIWKSEICDGKYDCRDASDEVGCIESPSERPKTSRRQTDFRHPWGRCTFENDICGWRNSHDEGKWKRQTGKENVHGPSEDVTTRSSSGHFVVTNMTRLRRGSKTELHSLAFPSAGAYCELKFSYFLSGKNVGTLGLYLVTESSTKRIWFEYGDVGRTWHVARIALHSGIPTSFHLTFRATADGRRGGNAGEIGIDDVKFSKLCWTNVELKPCQSTQFQCGNALCINCSRLCDFVDDCGDASDELQSECDRLNNRCDFDTSLCGWSNVYTNDEFDWTPFSGRTVSGWTGPVADHTKRDISGRYVYIEASRPRQQGDRARLVSPTFGPIDAHCIVRFYYHMYGSNVGSLSLYSNSSNVLKLIFQATGSHGDMWHRGDIRVPPSVDRTFQLVFEGVVGDGYQGDIAIDDVSFSDHCGERMNDSNLNTLVYDASCDFELSYCGWTNAYHNPRPWIRNSRATLSEFTGPLSDHTRGTTHGHYVYFEVSGVAVGQTSSLRSPVIESTPFNRVLTFWVFMYGSEIGCLEVQRTCHMDSVGKPVWTRCGDQGNEWILVTIDTMKWSDECTRFEMIFVGTVGGSHRGDIAIDDIQFAPSSVSYTWPKSQHGCTFDGNLCEWTDVGSESGSNMWSTVMHNSLSFVSMAITDLPRAQSVLLESPIFERAAVVCGITFRYRMRGQNVGTLGLYSVTKSGHRRRWWYEYGDLGEKWFRASQEITGGSTEPLKIYFNVTNNGHSDGKKGWVDIDYVTFSSACNPEVYTPKTPNHHEFICRNGYVIDESRLCDFADDCGDESDESLSWCLRNSAACSFETGMCGWHNNDVDDDFDWWPYTGRTVSGWTGPIADHTLADDHSGRYLYLEASKPRKLGDNTKLWSPRMFASANCKFRFFYHLYGDHIGNLSLLLKTDDFETFLFSASGNHGDTWLKSEVNFSANERFFLVFEGVIGDGYRGDIAIDDLSFSQQCSVPMATTRDEPVMPSSADCTFEHGVCMWTNDYFNSLPWVIHNGPTVSVATGADRDHTLGTTKGHYMYFEVTGLAVNQTSVLQSAPIKSSMFASRLEFWYHMNGVAIGCLVVEKLCHDVYHSPSITSLWETCGSQGDEWLHADVNVVASRCATFSIRFVGSVGGNNAGDIAIDDIKFQPLSTDVQSFPTDWDTVWSVNSHDKWIGEVSTHQSPVFTRSGHLCSVTFEYKMYGHNVGLLGLYLSIRSGQTMRIWFEYGDQGEETKTATVRVHPGGVHEDFILYYNLTENGHGKGRNGSVLVRNVTFVQCDPALDASLASCTDDEFWCDNGFCVAADRRCDFSNDCGDWSDETSDVCHASDLPNCNFEVGFCDWMNVYGRDMFDWTPFSGRTPSGWTGPMTDHTVRNSTGRYLFIESSSPRRQGDTARLVSPLMQPTHQTANCVFRFYYHMYGKHVGSLLLFLTSNYKPRRVLLFNVTGNQGDKWIRGSLHFTLGRGQYRLVIEASVGDGHEGDIAIDDVSFSPECQGLFGKLVSKREFVASKADCSFEDNYCGWENGYSNPLPWTRNQGETLSQLTGPDVDYSKGTRDGYYLYFEISGVEQGMKSTLRSPLLNASMSYRYFLFRYHMYGNETGCLSVGVWNRCDRETKTLWVACGDKGSFWQMGEVELPAVDCDVYRLVIEGTSGGRNRGDICLDDISFMHHSVLSKLPMVVLEICNYLNATIVLEGCILQYSRLLYWRDASLNTLDYCIGGMHLTIH